MANNYFCILLLSFKCNRRSIIIAAIGIYFIFVPRLLFIVVEVIDFIQSLFFKLSFQVCMFSVI